MNRVARLTLLCLSAATLFFSLTWEASAQRKGGLGLGGKCGCTDACLCCDATLFWSDPCGCTSGTPWPQCKDSLHGTPASTYVGLEYLALFRDTMRVEPTVAPEPSFDNDLASGMLLTVGTALADDYRLEMIYFGSHEWDETTLLPNGNQAAYGSQLNNVELLLRRRVSTGRSDFAASYAVGARFMDIEDALFINGTSALTQNELIGAELGLLMQWAVHPQTWVDWEVRGAVANNQATVAGLVDQDVTSFVGETSVVLNYQFHPSWIFRAGYRGIWVTGLAVAEENVGVPLIDDSGEMVFHGLNLGVVWTR